MQLILNLPNTVIYGCRDSGSIYSELTRHVVCPPATVLAFMLSASSLSTDINLLWPILSTLILVVIYSVIGLEVHILKPFNTILCCALLHYMHHMPPSCKILGSFCFLCAFMCD